MVLILTKSYNRYLKAHILETFIIFGCIGARMIDVLYANVFGIISRALEAVVLLSISIGMTPGQWPKT